MRLEGFHYGTTLDLNMGYYHIELFSLETVRVYIDDPLHVTKVSWTEHITVLEEMSTRLQKAGLKVNVSKSCFGAHKFDCFGYHVTSDRVMHIPNKV